MAAIFNKIEKVSTTQQVAEALKDYIQNGTMQSGSRLLSERELAAQFGVSRPVIREALVILSSYGLIETRQGEGTFIVDHFSENIFSFMGIDSSINLENYQDFFKARQVIECGIVADIIKNIQPEDIENLRDINSVFIDETVTDSEMLVEADLQFHDAVMNISKNKVLIELYKMVFKMFKSSASFALGLPHVKRETHDTHESIIRAFEQRDYTKAVTAVNYHLDISTNNLIRALST